MKDYYQILEVPPNASQERIKEQYRFLVHAWHPDKFPNPAQKAKAEEKIKEINEAYEVLSNPTKRAQYDRERSRSSFDEEKRNQEKAQAEAEQRRTEQESQYRQRTDEERRRAEHERQQKERAEAKRQQAEYERQQKERANREKSRRFITTIVVLVLFVTVIWIIVANQTSKVRLVEYPVLSTKLSSANTSIPSQPVPTQALPLATATPVLQSSSTSCQFIDDFSSYRTGIPPDGWLLRGEQSITPVIVEFGGKGPDFRAVSFPEVSWQYWDKWLLKADLICSRTYEVTVKLIFKNEVADRAGITIAWNETNWDRIDVQANVYHNDIEFRPTYSGPTKSDMKVNNIGKIPIEAGRSYWIRVLANDHGSGKGKVTVFWSTDGINFQTVVTAEGLPNLTGLVGISTAGPHLPNVIFDDFQVKQSD